MYISLPKQSSKKKTNQRTKQAHNTIQNKQTNKLKQANNTTAQYKIKSPLRLNLPKKITSQSR